MRSDQGDVDAAGDHLLQCGIVGRLPETVEPTMLEVRNARRELEAEQADLSALALAGDLAAVGRLT